MKRIVLACSAGMSTSLLVTKMQQAAEAQGFEATIYAVSVSELVLEVEKNPADIILLGPQVSYMEEEFKKDPHLANIPIAVINMLDYGTMNGAKVIEYAKSLLDLS
ncbi:PTS sugar transporter subunit IIB [Streptococcus suis]|uniref:PTS sugar transporter subunit IIB n=2 Tax=Streptococcus suis TaxID=1307 RepID=A0A7Y6RQM0_STRSU|nr:PTS sugar transporter subunit IIB [Streptococcus suis]AHF59465.1 PTS system, cellobiose-specific IIB component [Streptococcus suis 05HAS68]ALA29558.1 PTS cellobiose transporter subunit IIB [Streptococcus suis]AMU79814.1 cellobiose-specific component IIB of PTS system [Streptococcus suis]AUW26809.1 PTS sugar transporter subunit IIB [Streptococcus suis]KPA57201.1 PTS cellobiose transporter subunit IIB [Streptococcus suis]